MFILLLFYSISASKQEAQIVTKKLDSTTYYANMNQAKTLHEDQNCFQILLWKRKESDHRIYSYTDKIMTMINQFKKRINQMQQQNVELSKNLFLFSNYLGWDCQLMKKFFLY